MLGDLPACEPEMREGEEAPPAGMRAMAFVRWIVLALSVSAAIWSLSIYTRGTSARAAAVPKFYCPMHVQVTADAAGSCPICHMTLEPIPTGRQAGAEPHAAGSAHPHVPTPVMVDLVPNRTTVSLSWERLSAVGAKTTPAKFGQIAGVAVVSATVAAPERGIAVHSRVRGNVERVNVRETGVRVQKGQVLCTIRNPEIIQLQNDLLARRDANDREGSHSVWRKLESMGMTTDEIGQVHATSKPIDAFNVVATVGGHVSANNAVLGSLVAPEATLFTIIDGSSVYLFGDLKVKDLVAVRVGTLGRFFLQGKPSQPIPVRVDFIDPEVEPAARTVQVRMVGTDPRRPLQPGDFGKSFLATLSRRALLIPRTAVVDAGGPVYVFVEEGEGRFVPRIVVLGAEANLGLIEVESGLSLGESVVSASTFLIDAESALQASVREGKSL